MDKEIISKYNIQLPARCYGVFSIMSRFCHESYGGKYYWKEERVNFT